MRHVYSLSFCLCLAAALLLTACQAPQGGGNRQTVRVSEIPGEYKQKTAHLNFNIGHIETHNHTGLKQSYAEKVQPDSGVAALYFFDDQELSASKEDGMISLTNGKSILYLSENNMVYLSNSSLQSNALKSFSLEEEGGSEAAVKTDTEFSDHAAQEEKERLESVIAKLGVENPALYKRYDLDGCSYWLGIQECQGVPVFTTVHCEGMEDEWMPVQILNSPEGIEMAKVDYDFRFRQGGEETRLLPFDQAAEALEQEYAMLLTDNQHDVTGAELYFWIDVNQEDSEYRMEPVWVFTMHEYQEGKEENFREYQEMIHAVTGKSVEVRG